MATLETWLKYIKQVKKVLPSYSETIKPFTINYELYGRYLQTKKIMKNYTIKGQINLIKKRITKEEFYNRLPEKFKIKMLKNKFNICDTTIRTRIKELVLEKKLAIGKNFTYSKISPTKEIIKHDKYTIFVFKTSDINEVNEFVKTLI